MTSQQLQDRILERLASRGACGPFILADELDEAPFRILAELKELDRQHYTHEHPRFTRLWRITPRGRARINSRDQLKVF